MPANMYPGDALELRLEGFTGGDVTTTPTNGPFRTMSYNRSAGSNVSVLILTVGEEVQGESLQTVVVAMGIVLPSDGLEANSTRINIFVRAKSGPVVRAHVPVSQPVGFFLSSPRLVFDPPQAAQVVKISIDFTPVMAIAFGKLLTLNP